MKRKRRHRKPTRDQLAVISVVTEELVRISKPSTRRVVRDMLSDAIKAKPRRQRRARTAARA